MKRMMAVVIVLVVAISSVAYAATGGFDFKFVVGNFLGIGNVKHAASSYVPKADSEDIAYVTVSNNGLSTGDEISVYVCDLSGDQVTYSKTVTPSTTKVYPGYYTEPAYGADVKYSLNGDVTTLAESTSISGLWTP